MVQYALAGRGGYRRPLPAGLGPWVAPRGGIRTRKLQPVACVLPGKPTRRDAATSDLELRARLFFAAARNGVSLIRTEEDFREHFKNAAALLDSYLGGENTAALHDALEQRLKAAAAGGKISGADGMAMFDVFMRLNSHFDPAVPL